MLNIKTFQGATLARGASLVLTNGLYVPGWLLKPELEECVALGAAYDGTLLVGHVGPIPIAQLLRTESGLLMAFVRQDHRGKGYGSTLVKRMKEICPEHDLSAGCGIVGSHIFWQKSDISLDMSYGPGIPEPTW